MIEDVQADATHAHPSSMEPRDVGNRPNRLPRISAGPCQECPENHVARLPAWPGTPGRKAVGAPQCLNATS